MFAASSFGFCLLLVPTAGLLPFLAAFLIDIGQGAELDIIPYMASRYFGLAAFAEIYGYLFAVFTFGGVVGPVLMGQSIRRIGIVSADTRRLRGCDACSLSPDDAARPYRSTQLAPQPA
jgi:hypothetical protein